MPFERSAIDAGVRSELDGDREYDESGNAEVLGWVSDFQPC
jgi:hypothetical protein